MATADTATAPAPVPGTPQLMQRFNELEQRQKMAGAAALALAISLLVGVWLWSRTPDYAVVFANLEERDGGAIVTALQQQNIPYRFSPGGSAILIPANMVHDVRLRLAAQGLPRGGLVGFEVMENQKLGVSQFLEQVNYQRALEGELSRTIQSIASVASARVHLAIPRQSGFLRDEQKPSASVMVNLYPGRSMESAQVAGIVHLVGSSVPHLAHDRVSVVDQNGNLLTQRADPLRNAGLDASQLAFVREVESGFARRIETILAPLVGRGNFRAQVAADLDFNQVEATAETFKPNPSPDQAIRSQQTSEQVTRDAGAIGVPGALSNQPPVPATAPIVDPAVPGTVGTEGTEPRNSNRAATTNYELDRTIQHTRQAPGQVRRLSVAVVLNHRTETLPNGQTRTVPLSDAEIDRITSLVREAAGLQQERGDTLTVTAAPFAADDDIAPEVLPAWRDAEIMDLAKEGLKYALVLFAVMLVFFGVIRPLVRSVTPEPQKALEPPEPQMLEGDEGVSVTIGDPRHAGFDAKLMHARELARNDPRMVAGLIKDWMGGTEEGKK